MGNDRGLQLLRDERHQRHEWRAEIVAWPIVALVLLAALAGLLGPGPLSRAVAEAKGVRLEYHRFSHYQGPERLVFRLAPGMAVGGRVRLWIDRHLVEGLDIEQVDPWPAAVEAEGGRYVWVFLAPKEGEAMVATIRYRPDFIGMRQGRAGVDGGPEVTLRQVAYP